MTAMQELGGLIEFAHAVLDGGDVRCIRQIDLVEQDAISSDDLIHRLIVATIEHRIIDMLTDVHHIHHGDDGIQADPIAHIVIDIERRCHRRRIGQAAGFHQDAIQLLGTCQQLAHDINQVIAYIGNTADAAIGHGVNLFFRGHHQVGVDIDLAEFVFNHGNLVPMPLLENVVQQGGFAGTEKAGQYGHRYRCCCHVSHAAALSRCA